MVVIVDIADFRRVLVDSTGSFPRCLMPLRRLTLTKLKVPGVLRGARTGTIRAAAKKMDLDKKWSASPAAQKMNRFTLRRKTTDLDRFRIMLNRKQRNYEVRKLTFAAAGGKKAAPKKAAPKKAAKKGAKKK